MIIGILISIPPQRDCLSAWLFPSRIVHSQSVLGTFRGISETSGQHSTLRSFLVSPLFVRTPTYLKRQLLPSLYLTCTALCSLSVEHFLHSIMRTRLRIAPKSLRRRHDGRTRLPADGSGVYTTNGQAFEVALSAIMTNLKSSDVSSLSGNSVCSSEH